MNATFVTLLASCQLQGIETLRYMRDLLCLVPNWPAKICPGARFANWKTKSGLEEADQWLAANVFRQVSLGALPAQPIAA